MQVSNASSSVPLHFNQCLPSSKSASSSPSSPAYSEKAPISGLRSELRHFFASESPHHGAARRPSVSQHQLCGRGAERSVGGEEQTGTRRSARSGPSQSPHCPQLLLSHLATSPDSVFGVLTIFNQHPAALQINICEPLPNSVF